jgi:hypothetical protein
MTDEVVEGGAGSGKRPAAVEVAARIAAATLGAYAVDYGLTAALAALMGAGGADKVDAAIISSSVGLVAFPIVSVWAFGERKLRRVVGVSVLAVLAYAVLAVALAR